MRDAAAIDGGFRIAQRWWIWREGGGIQPPGGVQDTELRFGGDGDVDVGAFFELHVVAILVGQGIFDAQVAIAVVGAVDSNLRFFVLAWTRRRDDLIDGARKHDARSARNSVRI